MSPIERAAQSVEFADEAFVAEYPGTPEIARASPDWSKAIARAVLEAIRPELETARQTLREAAHAQSSGANWYTNGASGLYQQVAMHLERGNAALDALQE